MNGLRKKKSPPSFLRYSFLLQHAELWNLSKGSEEVSVLEDQDNKNNKIIFRQENYCLIKQEEIQYKPVSTYKRIQKVLPIFWWIGH